MAETVSDVWKCLLQVCTRGLYFMSLLYLFLVFIKHPSKRNLSLFQIFVEISSRGCLIILALVQ